MRHDDVRDFARNLIAAECYIDEPYKEGDPAYDVLSPRSQKEVQSLVERLMRKVTQYGDQREKAGRINENKRWLTVLAPSMDENVAYNSDFHYRIAELKAKEAKGE